MLKTAASLDYLATMVRRLLKVAGLITKSEVK